MAEKENPASGDDQNRTHAEAPAEGDSASDPEKERQHTQDAAEGEDAGQN